MKNITLIAIAACLSTTIAAHASTRITPSQAEAAAVKKIPGKAVSSKYEFEDCRWQYAVLVKNKTGMYEIEVNAKTGKVMDSEKTSPREEAQEAAADKKASRAHKSK